MAAMTMKRKRSDSQLSHSSSSLLSSPQSNEMDIDMCSSPINQYQDSHLSGRTRKRLRNNRPSDEAVHRMLPTDNSLPVQPLNNTFTTEHTLSLLYSAQKQPYIDPLPSTVSTAPTPNHSPTEPTQRSSLHSFWPGLSSQKSPIVSEGSSPPVNIRQQTKCEDCDSGLTSDDDSMDIDMDLSDSPSDSGCVHCGKQVCDPCSISNLGTQRQCLICAGKRRYVGGLGWVWVDGLR